MKDYTAIGSMLYGTGGESFKRGILGGVSRTLKAHNSNTMVVLVREIDGDESTEIHPGVEVQPERLGVPDGGVSPCLNVGQHHGTGPKIVEINDTQMQKPGVDGREAPHPH